METDNFNETGPMNNESSSETLDKKPTDFDILSNMPTFEEHMAEVQSQNEGSVETDFEPLTEDDLSSPINTTISENSENLEENPIFNPLTEEDLLPNPNQITQPKSPINGSELIQTSQPGIMASEHDNLLYRVTNQGDIIPLKSPINGSILTFSKENHLIDESTGQEFRLNESGEITPYSPMA